MGVMNTINPLNYFSSQKESEKKEIKATFMPRIKREPNDKKFVKLSKYLTQHLIKFFDYNEIYELGKTNVFFMNNVIEYLDNNETWPEQVRKLKLKYNFQIYQNEVDLTLQQAKENKRRYKFPKEEHGCDNYYQFDLDGNRYISTASSHNWWHTDNPNHWTKDKMQGSYVKDQEIHRLISVCWLNTNFHFYHVNPNNNYKLYINEYFLKNRAFENSLQLTIKLGVGKIIYQNNFPSKEIFMRNCGPKENMNLKEDFICNIKKEDFNDVEKDLNGDCLVNVEFYHKNNYWKSGWCIDGGSLVELSQKELEKEEKINEEKKINLRRFGRGKDDE